MSAHADFSSISKITENVYLSGVYPLDENYRIIKELGIKYILACLDRYLVAAIHDKILADNPDVTILYLPYNDDMCQNLWVANRDQIQMIKYTDSVNGYNKLRGLLNMYQNKPMIEIGYHFMDHAIDADEKILVHCMAGVSRSVSTVTYYFMKKYYLDYDEVIKFIKQNRKVANPNESFKLQLKNYDYKRDKFTESDAECIIGGR